MEKECFNWCFIGCGKLAKKVARQILSSKRHRIVSVYSRSFEKAKKFAKKYNAKACENVNDAINETNVDGVYIVTPHNAHYRFAKIALEAKKPCLVEKPLVISLEEAMKLKELSIKNNTYIAEAMWTWFCKSAHEVLKIIKDKTLGEVKKVNIDFSYKVIGFSRLNDPKRAGGSLLDLGVYTLTYMYRLFGYPINIDCHCLVKNKIDVEDEIILDYGTFKARCHSSFISNISVDRYKIICEKGKIVSFGFNWSGFCIVRNGWKTKIIKHKSNYLNEFDKVVEEIKKGLISSELVPLDSSIDVMKIMEECLKQNNIVYECE